MISNCVFRYIEVGEVFTFASQHTVNLISAKGLDSDKRSRTTSEKKIILVLS